MRRRMLEISVGTWACAALLGGCSGSDDPPPVGPPVATATPTMPVPTASEPVQSDPRPGDGMSPAGEGSDDSDAILGPEGLWDLNLGITAAQVKATGQATITVPVPKGGGCGTFDVKRYPGDGVGGYISGKYGLATIFARPRMRTFEGIALGSARAQVEKAYPDLRDGVNGSYVAVPGNPKAVYSFRLSGGKVKELALSLKTQDCHGRSG